jgi:hypothetical protein
MIDASRSSEPRDKLVHALGEHYGIVAPALRTCIEGAEVRVIYLDARIVAMLLFRACLLSRPGKLPSVEHQYHLKTGLTHDRN